MSGDIFVYIQKNTKIALELLGAARTLVQGKQKVCALLIEDKKSDKDDLNVLFEGGADKVFEIIHKKFVKYNCDFQCESIIQLVEREKPSIVLIGATNQGRDLAPRVSSRLNTGLTADCTKLEMLEHKNEMRLAATRPTFGGQLMATILCKTNPQMASVREGVLKRFDGLYNSPCKVEEFIPDIDNMHARVRIMEAVKDSRENQGELEGAKIIFAGGKGLKKEGFDKIKELVQILNSKGYKAALGASRKAVDMGLAEHCAQVGQTGKTVCPEIYVAFGISGAIQHSSGMQNSGYVIAVNSDPNASIFKNCDIGIVKDAHQVLEQMVSELNSLKKESVHFR